MKPTGKQVQWACIVAGATAYFFLGALTETGLALQFSVLIGLGIVLPTALTRFGSFAPTAAESGNRSEEAQFDTTWNDRK